MSVYMTEEEQLESIKKWWKRHGNVICLVLSIVLFALAGYRYFNWHQEKQTQQASIAYEQMMLSLSNQNNKSVKSYANALINEHSGSVYADVAHLTLAKLYVTKNQLVKALAELRPVAEHSKMLPIKQIAIIRMARIYTAQKSYPEALKALSRVEDPTYAAVINELKGDVHGAMGHYAEAMEAYKQAMSEVKTTGMGNLFLEMKSNELAVKAQSFLSDEKKVQST